MIQDLFLLTSFVFELFTNNCILGIFTIFGTTSTICFCEFERLPYVYQMCSKNVQTFDIEFGLSTHFLGRVYSLVVVSESLFY